MARKVSKELKKLIGKLPENWDKMTLEQKIWQVDHKWCLLSTELDCQGGHDDMYDLEGSIRHGDGYSDEKVKSVSVCLAIAPNADHQFTYKGSCFAIPKPAADGQVDLSTFPKYLLGYIKKQAYEDWDTNKKYTCMLVSYIEADTFEQAAKEMWFFLDLLTLGYEMTEIEWYMEKHPDLFPEHNDDDDDWDDEEEDKGCGLEKG
ncbi:MAG: hypothetical protein J6R05_02070 [Bacteroidaceae bacterium]|nr:hypothetical protein [Bacteroidaceae bacterium]